MRINIKATNFPLTPPIRQYVEKKMGRLERYLARFEKEEIGGERAEIELFVEVGKTTKHHYKGDVFSAEATLIVKGRQIRTEKTSEDLMASIDKVAEMLKNEIIEFKERNSE